MSVGITNKGIPITISMASHPPRKEGVVLRVKEILPQLRPCDRLRLYLNGYDEEFVDLYMPKDDSRLQIILAGKDRKFPDLGSQGKFYHVGLGRDGKPDNGYWLTIDDDIIYPPGYVEYMVEGCQKYHNSAVVTIHGGTFNELRDGKLPLRPARDCRSLVEYWRQRDRDMHCHTAGCGIAAMHPATIGLDETVITGPLHSGDDEDLAVWSQRNGVPIIRLAGRCNWVVADPGIHIVNPLYGNSMALAMADEKLKSWTKWHFPPFEKSKPTSQGVTGMFDRPIEPDELAFCNRTISSDALAAIISDRLYRKVPTSVVRFSDGERAAIVVSEGGDPIPEFKNDNWLERYGLLGADMRAVGANVLKAGNEADFVACSISGLYLPYYRTWTWFKERKQFVDQFYPTLWNATDRVGAVFASSPNGIIVVHRNADTLLGKLRHKYHVEGCSVPMKSWQEHNQVMKAITKRPEQLVLVSGGASGKLFCVQLAKVTGKVVLDVGEALESIWGA